MKIVDMKTNHITNPLGFDLSHIALSWKVVEAKGNKQKEARILVAENQEFTSILLDTGMESTIDSRGYVLEVELKPCTRYYWKVTVVTDIEEISESEIAWFETGKKEVKGNFITAKAEGISLEYRTKFTIKGNIKQARMYACGLGFYEVYINETKVGEEYLAPGLNDYDSWVQLQTYDVTDLLKNSNQEINVRAWTGDGLFKGRFGFDGGKSNLYGEEQAFLSDLDIVYEDGSIETIATGLDWEIGQSKIVFSDIYDGEIVDDTFHTEEILETKIAKIDKSKLTLRYSLPVIKKLEIKPIEIIKTKKGDTVLDMGQNMVGFITFLNKEKKGTKITLATGEIMQEGEFYNENLRVSKSEFTYISDGIEKIIRPHFTYYGFRYVKVTGFETEISLDNFTGWVLYSDMEETGHIHTSNPMVNQLFSNALWGQRGNFLDVPTDCPQRDERMGWTGDAQVFCKTAAFNMDIAAFMRKYCYDMKLEQRKYDGMVPMVVPAVGIKDGGSCAWADAATIIPWTMYEIYGDKTILVEAYEGMKAWADFIRIKDVESGDHKMWTVGFHFGDWLAMDGEIPGAPFGGTETAFIASCYYYMSTNIVSKAATVLGKVEEAEHYDTLANQIKEAIRDEYLTKAGRLAIHNQTAYALALHSGIVPDHLQSKVAKSLYEQMKKDNGYLKTGFVGTPILCKVLSEYGYNDMAYKLLLNEELPSWFYCIKMGATTIWERWDSVLPDGSMNPQGMNSLNHYAYGSIAEWMYRYMAGITELEPGFKKIRLMPMLDYRMKQVDCTYESVMGTIKSKWKILDNNTLEFDFSIPFGVEAILRLPEKEEMILTSGKYHFSYIPEKNYLREEVSNEDKVFHPN